MSHPHNAVSLMANYVGLDPVHDIEWVVTGNPIQDFIDGKIDAFLAATPEPQILRAQKRSATQSSTTPSTGRGRSISAA